MRDSVCVCVIAALRGRLLCVMYNLCKVERIVLTELNEDYY